MPNHKNLIFWATAFLIFLNIFVLSAADANAQLDPAFGTNGAATASTGVDNHLLTSGVLSDGKILVVSQTECCGAYRYFFVRFNAGGTLDSTYGNNGVTEVTVPFTFPFPSSGTIGAAAIQPDGKVILAGNDNGFQTITVRYNQNGTLDTSFASGGVHKKDVFSGAESARMVTVLPDGKILIAGYNDFGNYRLYLLRYNSNGSLDTSFGSGGSGSIVHPSVVYDQTRPDELLAVQSSGKILVGLNYGDSAKIRRFNNDGTFDNSFTEINFATVNYQGVAASVQPDGKILAASTVSKTETLERTHHDTMISRYNPDGTADTAFGTAGQVSFDISAYQYDKPMEIAVMPDGQILVTVNTYLTENRSLLRYWTLAYARLSSSGALNGKFVAINADDDANLSHLTILPDGKILTAYKLLNGNILLVRALGVPLVDHKFHGIPFNFPNGSTTLADPVVYRPNDRKWYINFTSSGFFFGLSDDIPVPGDFIKDFYPEFAVFRPSEGTWYIAREYSNAATNFLSFRWGTAGDIPVPGDFNGDGKDDPAVFRPSNGVWYIYYIADGSYTIQQWGLNGDKPAPGDYDGDGKYDIAVFRPSDGNWYIQRSLDGGYTILHFGLDGDVPVQEDYDGDGRTDIAVYRPSNGVWYRLNSSDGSFFGFQWGLAGDLPVPADYDGDGKINIAVWRPSNNVWYILNPDQNSMHHYVWGATGDVILPAKY